jgi:hypothetical protein
MNPERQRSKMDKPIFLLGVGAQKAGTTWLHDYLQLQPEVDMGFMKEYHIFDQGHVADTTPKLDKRIDNYINSFLGKDSLSMRHKFRRNHRHYFSYFQKLTDQTKQPYLTGDITPSYAGLSVKVLKNIKSGLEKSGFNVKVMFLMREPVARCISANRMYSKERLLANPDVGELEAELLQKKYRQVRFEIRTRYDITIKNLEEVFLPEQIHYAFYEELFSDPVLSQICTFLELPFRSGNYNEVSNGSKVRGEIPLALKSEIKQHYNETYEYVFEKFGKERIEKLWKLNQ